VVEHVILVALGQTQYLLIAFGLVQLLVCQYALRLHSAISGAIIGKMCWEAPANLACPTTRQLDFYATGCDVAKLDKCLYRVSESAKRGTPLLVAPESVFLHLEQSDVKTSDPVERFYKM
jgi:hypothetical protein